MVNSNGFNIDKNGCQNISFINARNHLTIILQNLFAKL